MDDRTFGEVRRGLALLGGSALFGVALGCTLIGSGSDDDGASTASDTGTGDSGASSASGASTAGSDGGGSGAGSDGGDADGGDDGGGSDAGSDGGDADGGVDTTGGDPPQGPGVGPSEDPAPDANAPGEFACDGCPEAMIDLDDADIGDASVFTISGLAAHADGGGQFAVVNEIGQFMGGMLVLDESGNFEAKMPVFCGESLVKMVFTNDAGTSAYVKRVTNDNCLPSDVRATVAWDETAEFWTVHLVRFGGHINDWAESDCCTGSNCSKDGGHDWGVDGDSSDDPVYDLDSDAPGGLDDVYYPNASDGLTIMVENPDTSAAIMPAGTLYINVRDQPTHVHQLAGLQQKHVYLAADVDGMSGDFAWIDSDYDCAAEWDSMCVADLP